MSFNPDTTKQAQEVIFPQKSKKIDHPKVYFNHALVAHTNCHKHLGMYLDRKVNFLQQIKEKISKANRGIGVIWKLRHILQRHSLITIYKSFVRPHLDFSDIIYDQPNNKSFSNKIERVHYNAALAITGAIRGTSQTKLSNELGLESLKFRRSMIRLCMFYKIKTLKLAEYLYNLISNDHQTYKTWNLYSVETYFCRTDAFKYSFFPYSISEWNKLDPELHNAKSYSTFRKLLLMIGWPRNCKLSLKGNSSIIKASINYIKNSKRFDKSLFWAKTDFFFLHHRFLCCSSFGFLCYIHTVLFSSPFNLI